MLQVTFLLGGRRLPGGGFTKYNHAVGIQQAHKQYELKLHL